MDAHQLKWLDHVPELGTCYAERGRKIARRKMLARVELAEALQEEADLWVDLLRSGLWTRKELSRAMVAGMEPAAVECLPPTV